MHTILLFISYRVEKYIAESIILVYRWQCPLCSTLSPTFDFYVYELVGYACLIMYLSFVLLLLLCRSKIVQHHWIGFWIFEQLHKLTPTFAKAHWSHHFSKAVFWTTWKPLFSLDKVIISLINVLLSITYTKTLLPKN